jgi:DedD protein
MARRDTVDQPPADPGLPFKRRARRRLVGALVIGLGVAIILPFVLDREPRYPRPDIRVDIPSRDAQLPVRVQNEADAAASSAQRPPVSAEAARAARAEAGRVAESRDGSPAAGAAPDASQAAVEARQQARAPMVQQLEPPPDAPGSARAPAAPRPDPDAARAAAAKAEAARLEAQRQEAARAEAAKASAARAEAARQDAARAEAARQEAARAQAAPPPRAEPPRPPVEVAARSLPSQNWAVQIGQFARPDNARAAEARASALGLRAYSETLQTAQGDRVRVRAGPFATRAAAEEARSRLIAAGLEAALIAPEAPR